MYSSCLQQPFWSELEGCKHILLAGCGGGYDFFSALPLFMSLQKAGALVHLSNLTFSSSDGLDCEEISPGCFKITPETTRMGKGCSSESYFPEFKVSSWFKKTLGLDVPVYLFDKIGTKPMQEAFDLLVDTLKLDCIVLCDGGTDSLMFGNEQGLGTPFEDMTSMAAVRGSKAGKKFLLNLGIGVDCFHGVSHHLWLQNVAAIQRAGGFLGTFSLLASQDEAKQMEACYLACDPSNSIVTSSVVSAMKGEFGDVHHPATKSRTAGSRLYISPLMSLYFAFELEAVCGLNLYIDKLADTQRFGENVSIISEYRLRFQDKRGNFNGPREEKPIPY